MKFAAHLNALLVKAREPDQEGSRREEALNVLLLVSLVLALIPAAQRAVQISQGGPETTDHVYTLVVAGAAAIAFGLLLWLSRRGRPRVAARSLLVVYYAAGTWSIVAEGPGKSTTILIGAMFVVAGGVLCGSRPSALAALLIGVTLALVEALDSLHVLTAPQESSPAVPDAVGVVEIVGTLAAMALLLSARTRNQAGPVAASLRKNSPGAPPGERRSGTLSVREIQVVRLVALGRSNDVISRELFVSPRTVHSHVSSALRKTSQVV
ncbi:MAG: response regulator transcription factor [Solirubrobacteraceae bacterium]